MVHSWNYGIISLAFCPNPNNFPRLKAREIIRIWTKRAWNYSLISLVTIWLHILIKCCFCLWLCQFPDKPLIEWSASIKQPLAGTPRVTVKWRFNCIYLVCLHLWCYLINLICKYFFNSLALIFTKGAVRILWFHPGSSKQAERSWGLGWRSYHTCH